jgi:hypothetical protein
VPHAAQQFGLPTRTIYRHISSGLLPAKHEGKTKLVELEAVRRLAEARQVPPPPASALPTRPQGGAVAHVAATLGDGDLAARLFAAFDQGQKPGDLVQTERISPAVALQAWREYEALRDAGGGGQPPLAERVEALEGTIEKLRNRLREMTEFLNDFDVMTNARLKALDESVAARIGPAKRSDFRCQGCGSAGFYDAPLRCGCCGTEQRWGYPPGQ